MRHVVIANSRELKSVALERLLVQERQTWPLWAARAIKKNNFNPFFGNAAIQSQAKRETDISTTSP